MSIKGVYLGFFLPANMLAASVAKRPKVLPLASTTNHLRVISSELGIYVDMHFSIPRKIRQSVWNHAAMRPRIRDSPHKRQIQNRVSGAEKIDQALSIEYSSRVLWLDRS